MITEIEWRIDLLSIQVATGTLHHGAAMLIILSVHQLVGTHECHEVCGAADSIDSRFWNTCSQDRLHPRIIKPSIGLWLPAPVGLMRL